MRIGVHGKEFTRHFLPFVESILKQLVNANATLLVSPRFSKQLKSLANKIPFQIYREEEAKQDYQFFLSIGGDGTLLETLTHIGKSEIPILGINAGRMGFLATISKEETTSALAKVIEGDYTIDKRVLLRLESDRDIFKGLNFALNDFTIIKKDSSSMITVHAYIDGEYLNSYWSDGLIVSTPTGSTGYSLSCGGPLVFPRSGNFIITPVSPHNLTVRPIVVSDDSEITFEVEGRSKKFLVTLDSRIATVDDTVKMKIAKADFKAHLIQLEGQHYFKTLRQKLNWGLDIRN